MNSYRKIKSVHNAPLVNMGSIRLRQAFPLQGFEQISPFILLHHFDFTSKPSENKFNVPPHPHRGFCPITFIYEGSVEHEDSLGNKKVIGSNEVQWINAGSGIIHSEKADKEFIERGGRLHGIQLWINLPRSEKMNPPSYQPITKNEIVLVQKEGLEFRLISGSYDGNKGPAHSDVFTAMLNLKAHSAETYSLPAKHHVAFYVLEGAVEINENTNAQQHDLIVFDLTEGTINLKAQSDTKMLLLAGEPIHEPMVSYGPFVMTSEAEISEALHDYEKGKMGHL